MKKKNIAILLLAAMLVITSVPVQIYAADMPEQNEILEGSTEFITSNIDAIDYSFNEADESAVVSEGIDSSETVIENDIQSELDELIDGADDFDTSAINNFGNDEKTEKEMDTIVQNAESMGDVPVTDNTIEESMEIACEGAGGYVVVAKPRVTKTGKATWDCVWFGNYWQNTDSDGDGKVTQADKKDPIKWRILDIDSSGNALLLSDKLIEISQYNTVKTDITWEDSTLRSFLNGYSSDYNDAGKDFTESGFLNNAFSEAENGAILTTEVVNEDEIGYGVYAGTDTDDKIYCLSLNESCTSKYGFSVYGDDGGWLPRIGYMTQYVGNKDGYLGGAGGDAGHWWTRTPGSQGTIASYVSDEGISYAVPNWMYTFYGYVNDRHVCVRPALRINLANSMDLWSYAGTVRSDGSVNEKEKSNEPEEPDTDDDTIVLETDENSVTMLPGELRRLSVSRIGRYIYGVKWTVTESNPKNCITVSNGVVTAKKAGTAKVSASYGDTSVVFDITVDGTVPQNTSVTVNGKGCKITAAKSLTINMGASGKKPTVSVGIPAPFKDESKTIGYEVLKEGICTVGEPVYNNSDRRKASKATFEITPVEAGATYIVWYMENDNKERTQACTKVIVKKPVSELMIEDSDKPLTLNIGEGKRLVVIGTKNNTDTKALSFSVKGKGVKVSPSGYVAATVPGSSATVSVKLGKVQKSIEIRVAEKSGDYLTLANTSIAAVAPKPGAKAKTVALKFATPKKNQPSVTWSVSGTSAWISIIDGKLYVESTTPPGCYILKANPMDKSGGINAAYCELIIK